MKYEGEYFPGLIEDTKLDEFQVKVMCMPGVNWKWPDKDDICWYKREDVVQIIKEPILRLFVTDCNNVLTK